MYPRKIVLPGKSFLLFGPRGTGKTTWLKTVLPDALWFDLLRTSELLKLMRDPDLFRKRVLGSASTRWIVVDEVQKHPALLDEVQGLLTDHPGAYRFALTGSSARKLKRSQANLLAGRAVNRKFFPLTASELGFDFDLENLLRFGTLPGVRIAGNEADQVDFLEAYCANYVKEEVLQEALVKNLDSFSRFLGIAALANGQVTNVAGIARDAGTARTTVQGYFDILADTLLGVWLPAWRPRAKIKERSLPKFYFFDPGVVRGTAGNLREPVESVERGFLLETWVLHELRAHTHYAGVGGELCYWRTPSGSEVDFVWIKGRQAVGFEVKASRTWRPEFGRTLKELLGAGRLRRGYGVYLGADRLKDGNILVLPAVEFARELTRGQLL
jgi:predicted AAA+ superfamily ATPase